MPALRHRCDELGHDLLSWAYTTAENAGDGPARQAVSAGAVLVLVAGGDGTINAVAGVLAHTGVLLAVLPTGTGNLLARNLGLPLDLGEASEVALRGRPMSFDVGVPNVAAEPPRRFLVMAGVGFDAAMMADASPALKARLGWAAYVLSGLRHIRDGLLPSTISLDGGPPRRRPVHAVLIGNVGELQCGLRLLPAARPDDGRLDVAVLAPRGLLDWIRVLRRGPAGTDISDRRLTRLRARSVRIRMARPQPWEYDGDPAGTVLELTVEVDPGALRVMVPA